jgi:hypothetical protein
MSPSTNLEKNYYQTAANNILLFLELGKVVDLLKDSGISVIVLKGAALAKEAYQNIALRSMADLDLLISQDNFNRAREVLSAAGYQEIAEPEKSFNPFRSIDTGEVAFKTGNGVLIDLHKFLTSIEWLRWLTSIDPKALWSHAQPFEIDGICALQLSAPDMLVHLCLHLAAHSYAHSIGYNDLVQLIKHHEPFPWGEFLDRARYFKLQAASYFPLLTIATELDAPIPCKILDELKPSFWQEVLVRFIADPRKGLSGELGYTRYRSYMLHLAIADRFRDVVVVIAKLLFPGSRWLTQRYHLRSIHQVLLACLWHPFFVLGQGLLGVRETLIERRGK